jgi:transcriptional regulator GlxA family with amidase domain
LPRNPPGQGGHREGTMLINCNGIALLDPQEERVYLPHIPRDGVWLCLARTLVTTIRRSGYAEQILSSQRLIESLHLYTLEDVAFVQRALELLYATRGQVRMNMLAAHCCLSLRQFERRFKQLVGVSPKIFARLLRFEALRDALIEAWRHESPFCLADLAYRSGYQDQAHLIHEFKFWTGYTPGAFLALAKQRMRSSRHQPDPRRPPAFFR